MATPDLTAPSRSAYDRLNGYLDTLPSNWKKEALEGFAIHVILGTGYSGSPFVGIGCGLLSALATLVHASVTVVFKNMNLGKGYPQELLRGGVALAVTCCVSAALGSKRFMEKLIINMLAYGILLAIRPEYTDPNRANRFLIWV